MVSNTKTPERRSQAERRAETCKQVLDSACTLFGEQGYANTSLDDIAANCGVTTRPIYHYFGNKKALFAAVNDVMEERILNTLYNDNNAGLVAHWQAFLTLCDDPCFRQIVLLDSPTILGRERWPGSPVTLKARAQFGTSANTKKQRYRQELHSRMVMAAFAEAALIIAEAEDTKTAKEQANRLVQELFG